MRDFFVLYHVLVPVTEISSKICLYAHFLSKWVSRFRYVLYLKLHMHVKTGTSSEYMQMIQTPNSETTEWYNLEEFYGSKEHIGSAMNVGVCLQLILDTLAGAELKSQS